MAAYLEVVREQRIGGVMIDTVGVDCQIRQLFFAKDCNLFAFFRVFICKSNKEEANMILGNASSGRFQRARARAA